MKNRTPLRKEKNTKKMNRKDQSHDRDQMKGRTPNVKDSNEFRLWTELRAQLRNPKHETSESPKREKPYYERKLRDTFTDKRGEVKHVHPFKV